MAYDYPDPGSAGLNLSLNTLVRGFPDRLFLHANFGVHSYPSRALVARYREVYAEYLGLPGPEWGLPCPGVLGGLEWVIRFWRHRWQGTHAVVQLGAYPPMVECLQREGARIRVLGSFGNHSRTVEPGQNSEIPPEGGSEAFFVASPHNPLGVEIVDFPWFFRKNREVGQVTVVDGAYQEYGQALSSSDWAAVVNGEDSRCWRVVIRSLSKIGLAGARVGLIVGAPDFLRELAQWLPPFGVGTPGLQLGILLLGFPSGQRWLTDVIASVRRHRGILQEHLRQTGVPVVSAPAGNFVTVAVPAADQWSMEFRRRKIVVRDLSGRVEGYPSLLRITVPEHPEDFQVLLDVVGDILEVRGADLLRGPGSSC